MTCKEFERLIPDFIEKRLDYSDLKQFLKHMESCETCREELVIQFLVTEGMQRLEEGDTFDLQSELEIQIAEEKSRLKFHSFFLYLRAGLETLAAILIIGCLLWLFL